MVEPLEHHYPLREIVTVVRHSGQPKDWKRNPEVKQGDLQYGKQAVEAYWRVHRASHVDCSCKSRPDHPVFIINKSSNNAFHESRDEPTRDLIATLKRLHKSTSDDRRRTVLIFFQADGFMTNPIHLRSLLKILANVPLILCCIDGAHQSPQLWQCTAEDMMHSLHDNHLATTLNSDTFLARLFKAGLQKAIISVSRQNMKQIGLHRRNGVDLNALQSDADSARTPTSISLALPLTACAPKPSLPNVVHDQEAAQTPMVTRPQILELGTHDRTQMYGCYFESCSTYGDTKETIVDHILASHFPEGARNAICSLCGQDIGFRSNLRKHMANHFDLDLPCQVEDCRSGPFRSRFDLEKHIKSHTGDNRTIRCTYATCSQTFRNTEERNEHTNAIHLKIKFICELCGVAATVLDKHYLFNCPFRNGQIIFPCQVPGCQRTFYSAQIRTAHVQEFHGRTTPILSIAKSIGGFSSVGFAPTTMPTAPTIPKFNDYGKIPQGRFTNVSNARSSIMWQRTVPVRQQTLATGTRYTFVHPVTLEILETVMLDTGSYDFASALIHSCQNLLNMEIDRDILQDAISNYDDEEVMACIPKILSALTGKDLTLEIATIDKGRVLIQAPRNSREATCVVFYHLQQEMQHPLCLDSHWSGLQVLGSVEVNTIDAVTYQWLIGSYGSREFLEASQIESLDAAEESPDSKHYLVTDHTNDRASKKRRGLEPPNALSMTTDHRIDEETSAVPAPKIPKSKKDAWYAAKLRPSNDRILVLARRVDFEVKGWTDEKRSLLICHHEGLHGYEVKKGSALVNALNGEFSAGTISKQYTKWLKKPLA